jgi:prevent-host-death family protein
MEGPRDGGRAASMVRQIDARDASERFLQVLDEVKSREESYVVERDGEAVAAVVPIALYRELRRSVFDSIRESAERANMGEDEALALALEAQVAVRAERWREP